MLRQELLNLKIVDINSKRMLIHVRSRKGNKDRIVILSEKLLALFRQYFKEYRTKLYLFEGINEKPYSATSVKNIIGKAAKAAKIANRVTSHTMKHSFATHLLEQGTDLRYIQQLLVHSSTKTTEIYTHVVVNSLKGIKSPFDSLDL